MQCAKMKINEEKKVLRKLLTVAIRSSSKRCQLLLLRESIAAHIKHNIWLLLLLLL